LRLIKKAEARSQNSENRMKKPEMRFEDELLCHGKLSVQFAFYSEHFFDLKAFSGYSEF